MRRDAQGALQGDRGMLTLTGLGQSMRAIEQCLDRSARPFDRPCLGPLTMPGNRRQIRPFVSRTRLGRRDEQYR